MATRDRPADRGRRRARACTARLLVDIHTARIGAGLSLESVADAVGVSHARVGRLERGEIRDPSVELLGAVCGVVGLDLAVKAYPAGDPIRDAAHVRLLDRLRAELHPSLRFRTEQPFPQPGDLRAWDATIMGPGWFCHVEAETAVTDAQAMTRRLHLKIEDGGRGKTLLLISATRRNGAALALIRPLLADTFPLRTRPVLSALRQGTEPPANGIVVL